MIGKHKMTAFTEDQISDTRDVIVAGNAFGAVQALDRKLVKIGGMDEQEIENLVECYLIE
jgi:hypothetical protein